MKCLFNKFSIIFLFLLYFIATNNATAGTLTIRMDLSYTIGPDGVEVRIDATNHGSEPAFEVGARLHGFDQALQSKTLERLEIEQTAAFQFRIPVPPDKKGVYPLVAEFVFRDANRHPFSTLSGIPVNLGGKIPTGLSGLARVLTVENKKNIRIRVINAAPRTREVVATVYLPWSLDASPKQKNIKLAPRSYTTVDFPINSRYGINDATYPVYCTLEFDEQGHHQTVLVQSTVQIVRPKNWFVQTRWYWLMGGVFVIFGWIGVWVTGSKKKAVGRRG